MSNESEVSVVGTSPASSSWTAQSKGRSGRSASGSRSRSVNVGGSSLGGSVFPTPRGCARGPVGVAGRTRAPRGAAEEVDVVTAEPEGVGAAALVLDRLGLRGALVAVRLRERQLDRAGVRRRGARRDRGGRRDASAQQRAVGVGGRVRGARELLGHRDRLGGVLVDRRGGLGRAAGGSARARGVARGRRPCGRDGLRQGGGLEGLRQRLAGLGGGALRLATFATRGPLVGGPRRTEDVGGTAESREASVRGGSGPGLLAVCPGSGRAVSSGSRASSGRSAVTRTAPGRPARSPRSTGTRLPRSSPWRRCPGRRRPRRPRRSRPRARGPRRP